MAPQQTCFCAREAVRGDTLSMGRSTTLRKCGPRRGRRQWQQRGAANERRIQQHALGGQDRSHRHVIAIAFQQRRGVDRPLKAYAERRGRDRKQHGGGDRSNGPEAPPESRLLPPRRPGGHLRRQQHQAGQDRERSEDEECNKHRPNACSPRRAGVPACVCSTHRLGAGRWLLAVVSRERRCRVRSTGTPCSPAPTRHPRPTTTRSGPCRRRAAAPRGSGSSRPAAGSSP